MPGFDPPDAGTDPFGPPAVSILVGCLHCSQVYDSYRIEWRVETNADGRQHGFWCCPIAGCDGKGFCFDIFPVDPNYRDEHGELVWHYDEELGDEDQDEGGPAPERGTNGDQAHPGEDESIPW